MIKTGAKFRQRAVRPVATLLIAASAALALQGCAGVVLGTAVMTSLAATDRRTLGAQTEDKAIFLKAQPAARRAAGESSNVNVTSFNRQVLLTGEVRDEATKAAVEREVARVDGVLSIVNDIAVTMPSSLASRSNDTLITGKVKASFVDAKDIFANSIKVVTERGNVYLMGRVTEREGQRAAEVASRVGGVQKVVKVFDYITEAELQGLAQTPGNTQSGR
ncbi:MAG TPA: BON domain-containing protein [Noviherbaspirillum sp.]|nr:BON domain-containing protein [Noviherbaspirillum sp.]